MKNILRVLLGLSVLFGALIPALPAMAQGVIPLPLVLSRNSVQDFGNGPLRFKSVSGQAIIFSASGSGTGTSAGTTALTLAATAAANPPCVGCVISCANGAALAPSCSIPANTTVTAFNGTTGITTSVATTVTAATVVFGGICPTTTPISGSTRVVPIGPATDLPFWTQARLCGTVAAGQPGAQILTSAVNTVQ